MSGLSLFGLATLGKVTEEKAFNERISKAGNARRIATTQKLMLEFQDVNYAFEIIQSIYDNSQKYHNRSTGRRAEGVTKLDPRSPRRDKAQGARKASALHDRNLESSEKLDKLRSELAGKFEFILNEFERSRKKGRNAFKNNKLQIKKIIHKIARIEGRI